MAPRDKKKSRADGFTIVELMVVVAVIGILALLAYPAYSRARASAHQSACVNNLRVIDSAKDSQAVDGFAATHALADLVPDYLKKLPACPSGGVYQMNALGDNPTCNIPGHEL